MSMMFAALKRMEAPAEGPVRTTRAPASRWRAPRWLVPALCGGLVCGGVVVAVAGWAWVGGNATPTAVAPVAATPVPETAPVPVVATGPASEPEAIPVPVPVPATPAPVPVAQAVPAQPAAVPQPQPDIVVRDAREVGVPDDQAIARHVAAIGTALHGGDLDGAQAQVDALAAILPPRSLTLLRMQAWVAHQGGDSAKALSLYRSIVARMPSDQTAVINLAILEAAHGHGDSARQRLQHLRQADGNSRAIENAISLVEASLK